MIVVALFVGGLLAPRLLVARGAPAAVVTLRLWPAGQGRIDVTQGGSNLDPSPCDFTAILTHGAASPCTVTVTVGAPVTLTAVTEPNATVPAGRQDEVPDFPVAQPTFVRWSRSDCGTASSCTFTPAPDSDGEWITALFSPLQLQVGMFGSAPVTFRRSDGTIVQPACPQNVGFGDQTCHAALPADADIVIQTTGSPTGWSSGCTPTAGPTGPTCAVRMSNLRTFAFVSFNGQTPLDPPFRLTPIVKVKLVGSGQGRVSGSGIDCPGTCQVAADYQARVQLTAAEGAGSTFVRWGEVCSTDRTCAFSAGSATEIEARFDSAASTTTTSATTTGATTTTSATTTSSTTTSARTTTTTRRPRPRPQLTGVASRGRGAARAVAFVVVVDRPGRATVRLLKRRAIIASRRFRLARGRNALRLHVPRKARAGVYRLEVRIVLGGQVQKLNATVAIRR